MGMSRLSRPVGSSLRLNNGSASLEYICKRWAILGISACSARCFVGVDGGRRNQYVTTG